MHHPAWSSSLDGRSRDRYRDLLERIADTLGCPLETSVRAADTEVYPDDAAARGWLRSSTERLADEHRVLGHVVRLRFDVARCDQDFDVRPTLRRFAGEGKPIAGA